MSADISLIMPTYHPARVERANALYKMLKEESGAEIEVIVVCDNPAVTPLLHHDKIVALDKRVGFTRAVNIGEKLATARLLWWIDDYVIPEPGWAPKAIQGFNDRFPDGMGIMELSGCTTDCPKSISTREYLYNKNNLNLLWPEYLHCGDTELWHRSSEEGKFYVYPEVLWHRDKIYDACKTVSGQQRDWDVMIREYRQRTGWKNEAISDLSEKMHEWAINSGEPKNLELYKNLYNL